MIIKCQRQIPKIQQRIKTSNPRISTVCNFRCVMVHPIEDVDRVCFFPACASKARAAVQRSSIWKIIFASAEEHYPLAI